MSVVPGSVAEPTNDALEPSLIEVGPAMEGVGATLAIVTGVVSLAESPAELVTWSTTVNVPSSP